MNKTGIEYLTHSWNPIAMRCTPCSEGCAHCWHLDLADRFMHNPNFPDDVRAAYAGEGPPVLVEKHLTEPTRKKKPAVIGVQFMGDLWHEDVPLDFVDKVMGIIVDNPQHTFIVLTKRSKKMFKYFYGENVLDYRGPCMNLWLGVTVENQKAADERIPWLLRTPAAKRFLSCEPLLELIDLRKWLRPYPDCGNVAEDGTCASSLNPTPECHVVSCPMTDVQGISWVITGGESGTGARPMHPDWARSIRDVCVTIDVPYFHKQNGAWLHDSQITNQLKTLPARMWKDGTFSYKVGKKRAGHLLDGKEWKEWPK